jgi:leucyl aminopeptidase
MNMEVRAATVETDLADATLVIGVLEGLEAAPGSESELETVDRALLDAAGFEGKTSQVITVPHATARAALLVGLGDDVTFERVRSASGTAVRAAKTERLVSRLGAIGIDGATRAVVEGSLLGGFQYRVYKSNDDGPKVGVVEVIDADNEELEAATIVSEATNQARVWINTPAKDLAPEVFADQIADLMSAEGVEVEVWDRDRIEAEKLGALLGVAAGSAREPRVVVATYRPGGATAHLGLVGKGIMFDTGGLSIKSASFMEEMKVDMAGAATVVAATSAIARLGLPIDVTTVTPLTDNAVGGDATRPGDVLQPVTGPSIEVLNTDAEGRLILADVLGVARRFEPDVILDVATLTGAMRVALGDKITGVFASDPETADRVLRAASRAGEVFWEMPLHRDYRKSLDSTVADIKNVSGSRYGGAITAALFLAEYAGEGPWAHLDIAGPVLSRENSGDQVKGASGVAVRTLVEVARAMSQA